MKYKVLAERHSAHGTTKIEKIFDSYNKAFDFYYILTDEGFKAEVWKIEQASFGMHVSIEQVFLNS